MEPRKRVSRASDDNNKNHLEIHNNNNIPESSNAEDTKSRRSNVPFGAARLRINRSSPGSTYTGLVAVFVVFCICAVTIKIMGMTTKFQTTESSSVEHYEYYKRVLFHTIPATTHLPHMDGTTTHTQQASLSKSQYLLPQRPRTFGYYFQTADSSSFMGAETMDPNLIRTSRIVSRSNAVVLDHTFTVESVKRQRNIAYSSDYESGMADDFEEDDCKAQYAWQLETHPNCNLLHEVPLNNFQLDNKEKTAHTERVRLIANGYWRDVWRLTDTSSSRSASPTVMKTLRYEHDYEERNADRHRRDAIAMEKLTSSPYVMDVYAFCGNSGISEFADGGDISIQDAKEWNSTHRLVVAYQLASGLADLHNVDKENVASIAHTDITPNQFVYVKKAGVYKLNDFNRCRFIRWNSTENKACPFLVGSNPGTFRSPEEYAYEPETEKVDVYSLGNIYYAILTGKHPFGGMKQKVAQQKIIDGDRPLIPKELQENEDPFDQALLKVVDMCWKEDPPNRATARQVQTVLGQALKQLGIGGAFNHHVK
jgi:hypothetical protein